MKQVTRFYREIRVVKIKTAYLIFIIALLFFPSFHKIEHTGDNMYVLSLNGTEVGLVDSPQNAQKYLREARTKLIRENKDLVFVDAELSTQGKELWFGRVDSQKTVVDNMYQVLSDSRMADRSLSYMIKINQFTINIRNVEDVKKVLQAALNKYDDKEEFQVELVTDPTRELNVLTTRITNSVERHNEATQMPLAGVDKSFYEMDMASEESIKTSFEDFDYGMVDLYYDNEIEVIETYLPDSEISDVETATAILTQDQEKNAI